VRADRPGRRPRGDECRPGGDDDGDGDDGVGHGTDGTVLGALVLDGDRIDAVAVRRNRRGQGIGTALVEAAAARRERLVAEFDAGVRPFYECLGFAVESRTKTDRFRGVRPPERPEPARHPKRLYMDTDMHRSGN